MRFIDSNVFVYHLVGDPRNGKRSTQILESVEDGEETVTSTLAVAQVCGYLKWKKKERTIPVFLDLLRGLTSLWKAGTDFVDFVEASNAQKRLQLSLGAWDDLVLAAQMRRLGVVEIYSRDADFDQIPGIKRIF